VQAGTGIGVYRMVCEYEVQGGECKDDCEGRADMKALSVPVSI
jgi:hypothetical protein